MTRECLSSTVKYKSPEAFLEAGGRPLLGATIRCHSSRVSIFAGERAIITGEREDATTRISRSPFRSRKYLIRIDIVCVRACRLILSWLSAACVAFG